MSPTYQIRRKVAGGGFIPVGGPYKLEEAEARVRRLARIFPQEEYVLHTTLLSTKDQDSFGADSLGILGLLT
jgi:hypothetical protein